MGADLYISSIYRANHDKYEGLFNEACKLRNSLKIAGTSVQAIRKSIAKFRGKEIGFEENVAIPRGLTNKRIQREAKPFTVTDGELARYRKEVAAQRLVTKYYDLMFSKGYFRDSYNPSSLFWVLGLSWWAERSGKGRSGLINRQGCMMPRSAKKLLARVQGVAVPKLPADWAQKNHCEGTTESWQKYFIEKKKVFEAFLQEAIDAKQPIECSV